MVKGADVPVCSFCGKAKDAVAGLVAGPRAYICNERAARCAQLLEEPPDPDPDPDADAGPGAVGRVGERPPPRPCPGARRASPGDRAVKGQERARDHMRWHHPRASAARAERLADGP